MMATVVRWLTTLVAAMLGGMVGLFLILPLGLIVVEWIIVPLALVIGALLAALAAGWTAIWLARDDRPRLGAIVVTTELAALALALVAVGFASVRAAMLGPIAVPAALSSVILALVASVATWRLRCPIDQPQHDRRLTLGLLALMIVGVPLVLFIADLAGLTGA